MRSEQLISLNSNSYEGRTLLEHINNKRWKKILEIILSCLYFPLERSLKAVDNEGGTVLARLREILNDDLYDEIEYTVYKTTICLPPFLFALEKISWYDRPTLDQMRFFLNLGINVNHQYPSNNNDTALHYFLKCYSFQEHSVDITTLGELIEAGGNIYLENNDKEKPIDLVQNTFLKNFMKKIYNQYNTTPETIKKSAAIVLQRAIRSLLYQQYKTKQNTIFFPKRNTQNISLFFPKFNHPDLTLEVQEQTSKNTIEPENAKRWVNDHELSLRPLAETVLNNVYYISYAYFAETALPFAVEQFNQYLMSLPEPQRNYYVYLYSERYKSNPWVSRHAFNSCAHIPTDYIHSNEITKFEIPDNISHIVLFEDHSLSGNAIMCFVDRLEDIRNLNPSFLHVEIHIVIPFITNIALERLNKYPVNIHYCSIIPEFNIKGTKYRNPASLMYTQWKVPDTFYSTAPCFGNQNTKVDGNPSNIRLVPDTTPVYKIPKNNTH